MNPFEVVTKINTSSKDEWDDIDDYNAFMVTRSFSQFQDTIMLAQIVNSHYTMPLRWQYDFLRNTVYPKKKRFAKWSKPESDSEVELIARSYNVNMRRAESMKSLLSPDAINLLKERSTKGGR